MKSRKLTWGLAALVLALAIGAYVCMFPAQAADPINGARTARASAAIVINTVVAIGTDSNESVTTVATATAGTDAIIGVAEANAQSGAMCRYAPPGTRTWVACALPIVAGNIVTATTAGAVIPVDANRASLLVQRPVGIALMKQADPNFPLLIQVISGIAR